MFYESGTSSHSEAAGFCLSLHDTCRDKRNTERRRESDEKGNHIIIRTSFRKRASTGKTDFVKPKEHAHHSQQRDTTHSDAKPAGQSRGSALWSEEAKIICSCLAQELSFEHLEA